MDDFTSKSKSRSQCHKSRNIVLFELIYLKLTRILFKIKVFQILF